MKFFHRNVCGNQIGGVCQISLEALPAVRIIQNQGIRKSNEPAKVTSNKLPWLRIIRWRRLLDGATTARFWLVIVSPKACDSIGSLLIISFSPKRNS